MKNLYAYYAKAFEQGATIIPPSVEIDFTNSCNQNCIYCNYKEKRKTAKDRANTEDYYKLADKLKNWHKQYQNAVGQVCTVTFVGGGEPTLHKEYPNIIKHYIDKGFLVSLITNGVKLSSLDTDTAKKMSWIGIDFDAGSEKLYNKIRRPSAPNHYELVCNEAKRLAKAGVNIDYKVLLTDENNNSEAIYDIFKNARDINARMVYFRLAIINGKYCNVDKEKLKIAESSKEFNTPYKINLSRCETRNYQYCYSMHILPVFSATGNLCLCCENRENNDFILCDWTKDDFIDLWGSTKHKNLVSNINVNNCTLCRPNTHNIEIQNILDNPVIKEQLFF